jgi:uncharacterized membrane protein
MPATQDPPRPSPAPIAADPRLAPRGRAPARNAPVTGPAPAPAAKPARHRIGELRWLAIGLVFGLVALPLLVYAAGAATLGPYEGGLGAFLGTLYGHLVGLDPLAWALVLGKYVVFGAIRLLTRPFRRDPVAAPAG